MPHPDRMNHPCEMTCVRGHGDRCIAVRTGHRRYCALIALGRLDYAALVDRLSTSGGWDVEDGGNAPRPFLPPSPPPPDPAPGGG
jgi:hypothetical protein